MNRGSAELILERAYARAHGRLRDVQALRRPNEASGGHDPARWAEFRRKYRAELRDRADLLHRIEDARRQGPVTLLFAARDTEYNDAVVLKDLLDGT